jgi:hypothetical protein
MKKQKLLKPRNPFVQHLVKRKTGAHVKPYKTERRDAKASLKRDYSDKHVVFLNSLHGPIAELV